MESFLNYTPSTHPPPLVHTAPSSSSSVVPPPPAVAAGASSPFDYMTTTEPSIPSGIHSNGGFIPITVQSSSSSQQEQFTSSSNHFSSLEPYGSGSGCALQQHNSPQAMGSSGLVDPSTAFTVKASMMSPPFVLAANATTAHHHQHQPIFVQSSSMSSSSSVHTPMGTGGGSMNNSHFFPPQQFTGNGSTSFFEQNQQQQQQLLPSMMLTQQPLPQQQLQQPSPVATNGSTTMPMPYYIMMPQGPTPQQQQQQQQQHLSSSSQQPHHSHGAFFPVQGGTSGGMTLLMPPSAPVGMAQQFSMPADGHLGGLGGLAQPSFVSSAPPGSSLAVPLHQMPSAGGSTAAAATPSQSSGTQQQHHPGIYDSNGPMIIGGRLRHGGNAHTELKLACKYFAYRDADALLLQRQQAPPQPMNPKEQVLPLFVQMFPSEHKDRAAAIFERVLVLICGPGAGMVAGVEPRSDTSFIVFVRTSVVWHVIYNMRYRVLMDRHGFWFAENLQQYVVMKEYCEVVRTLPQQSRHARTDGMPSMPLVIELSRTMSRTAITAPPAPAPFDLQIATTPTTASSTTAITSPHAAPLLSPPVMTMNYSAAPFMGGGYPRPQQ